MVLQSTSVKGRLLTCIYRSFTHQLETIELEEVVSVGVVQGVETEEFGRISDVTPAGDGSFVVLDRQVGSVTWFDSLGTYNDRILSRGSGPGELASPLAVGASTAGRLAVLDPGNGRVNLYRFADDQLVFEGQMRSELSTLGSNESLCSLGDRWYARGPLADGLIHELGAQEGLIRSFGEVRETSVEEYGPFAQLVTPQLNAGALACVESTELLVTVDAFPPWVRAFTPDGELVWEVEVSGLHPVRFVVDGGALGAEEDPDEGSHRGRAVIEWGAESVLVQYVQVPPDGPARVASTWGPWPGAVRGSTRSPVTMQPL